MKNFIKGKRSVCLDTETTGLDPQSDRIIEIACVELIDFMKTGREYHVYIDPERDVPEEAVKIHGITRAMLKGKPKFKEVVIDMLEFIGSSEIVAHNAQFDIDMINAELTRAKYDLLTNVYVDTVSKAKERFGTSMSLDTLCRKLGINLSSRTKHGALIDTRLLSEAYLGLNGGRALSFDFSEKDQVFEAAKAHHRASRNIGKPSVGEMEEHAIYIGKTFAKTASLWTVEEKQELKL